MTQVIFLIAYVPPGEIMQKPSSPLPATSDTRAEGSQPVSDSQRSITTRTATVPAIRLDDDHNAPSAETGIQAVVKTTEPRESNEAQDASRTTAETATVPAKESLSLDMTPRVLLIEDSTELAEIIEVTLQRLNMVITHETHGSRAVAHLDLMKPDVVLLDLGLPDTTGWKVLEDLRLHLQEGMPSVVIITAYGDPANRLIGKLHNVHDYLIKPFTPDDVERVVMSALSSSAAG